MQAWYPAAFEREMGCTAAELRAQLPGACAGRPIELGADHARVVVGQGTLRIEWRTLAPRRIALLNIPRLAVSFRFEQVDEATRQHAMRFFDLFTQRGGG
jgi:hypothetical protein